MDVLIVPAFHQFYLAFNGFLKTPIDKILHRPPVMLKSKPSPSFFPYYFLHAMFHNISLLHFAAFHPAGAETLSCKQHYNIMSHAGLFFIPSA